MLKEAVKRFLGIQDQKAFNPAQWTSLSSGYSHINGSSYSQLMSNNKNWVHVCVDKIATTMANIELVVKKYNSANEDQIMVDSQPLLLLEKPNDFMTGLDFKVLLFTYLELVGNAYILKDKPQNPTELVPIPPNYVELELDSTGLRPVGYKVTTSKSVTRYTLDDIVHIKRPNPSDPTRGMGTLSYISEWVDLDNAATAWNTTFFESGSSPSMFFKTGATSIEELELAKLGYDMRHSGVQNAHKAAFLPKDVDVTSQGTNPRDMEFSESDKRTRDKIIAGYGVPKSVLGIVEDVNRANAESSNYVFLEFTIKPKVKAFIAYLNEFYLKSFTNSSPWYFDYVEFVPINEELNLKRRESGLAGAAYYTVNEVRAELGLEPLEGGDGQVTATPAAKPAKRAPASLIKSMQKGNAVNNILKDISEKMDNVLSQEEIDALAHKQFVTRVDGFEKKFIAGVKSHDELVQKQVMNNLDDFVANSKKKDFDYSSKDLFNQDAVRKLFIGFAFPIIQDLIEAEGTAQLNEIDNSKIFDKEDPYIQDRVKALLDITAQSYNDTTLKLLTNTLNEGILAGEGMDTLTERIADVFSLTNKYRAKTVANTTVFGAANAAARQAYIQSGVVEEVRWYTAEDERVCGLCNPMNGKTVGVTETYFTKGEVIIDENTGREFKLDFADIIDPPLHANCRCFTRAVITSKSKAVEENIDFLGELLKVLE